MFDKKSSFKVTDYSLTEKLGGGDHSNELGDVDMFGKNVFATNVVLECVLPAIHVATQSALKLDLQQVIF